MIISFICSLILFVTVGAISMRYSRKTTEDYLTASQSIKPWLVGFSAFASSESGFMFVGFIGMTYAIGLSAIWILIGMYGGAVFGMWLSGERLRARNEKLNAQTYSSLIANWSGQEYKIVRIAIALITAVFLSVYAAAQLGAGGKALNVIAGWSLELSAVIGFIIVLTYCLAGGIRATIWTDAVQALAIFGSLVLLITFALVEVGGFIPLIAQLKTIDPSFLNPFAGSYQFGLAGFFFGWFAAGFGVLGVPHIMVRYMVLDKAENAKQATAYYAGMVTVLGTLCTLAAMCAKVILPDLGANGGDVELALPTLSTQVMPQIFSGLFLAGLFAATMSSADSQILSSSAALTRDIVPKYGNQLWWSKLGTILVACFALYVAISDNKSIFALTMYAWSFMAVGIGPLVTVLICSGKPSQAHALIMMIGGLAAAFIWDHLGFGGAVFNTFPGVIAGLALYYIPAILMSMRPKTAPQEG